MMLAWTINPEARRRIPIPDSEGQRALMKGTQGKKKKKEKKKPPYSVILKSGTFDHEEKIWSPEGTLMRRS
jgi:hypothetical protein